MYHTRARPVVDLHPAGSKSAGERCRSNGKVIFSFGKGDMKNLLFLKRGTPAYGIFVVATSMGERTQERFFIAILTCMG